MATVNMYICNNSIVLTPGKLDYNMYICNDSIVLTPGKLDYICTYVMTLLFLLQVN